MEPAGEANSVQMHWCCPAV